MKYLSLIPLHTLDLTPNEEAFLDEQMYHDEWCRRNKGTHGRHISVWEAISIFKDDLYMLCIDKIANNEDKSGFQDIISKMRNDKKLDIQRARQYPIEELFRQYGCEIRHGFTCCPLHGEDTPSLKIYPATNTWHCFGCHVGSDSIDLMMKMGGLNFPEAVRRLI